MFFFSDVSSTDPDRALEVFAELSNARLMLEQVIDAHSCASVERERLRDEAVRDLETAFRVTHVPRRLARGTAITNGPAAAGWAHAQIVRANAELLERIRQRWSMNEPLITMATTALGQLRSSLPALLGQVAQSDAVEAIARLTELLREVLPRFDSAEEEWLALAEKDLDDDELARILSPGHYQREREAAIAAIGARRAKMVRGERSRFDEIFAEMPDR